ncbi:MAG: polyhydroxyalkanoate synthesis regulator DNA-binding domain-containing protein [Myxococcota bacterium]
MLVKKYSNRRLYDTEDSRYITLDELAEKVRGGSDVRVIDAKSGADLTQGTLTQIILESNAARLLPVPLLTQLIRMKDDALAEFFGQYVSISLEMYNRTRSGVQQVTPYFPFAQVPLQAADALFRMFSGAGAATPTPTSAPSAPTPPPSAEPSAAPEPEPESEPSQKPPQKPPREPTHSEVADLRRELDELKQALRQVTAAATATEADDEG